MPEELPQEDNSEHTQLNDPKIEEPEDTKLKKTEVFKNPEPMEAQAPVHSRAVKP